MKSGRHNLLNKPNLPPIMQAGNCPKSSLPDFDRLPACSSYKTIPLTQGKFAIVDTKNYKWLSQYKWCASYQSDHWYAVSTVQIIRDNQVFSSMHRLTMNTPKGKQTDHINHNGLDNRECNMRICTYAENQWNPKNPPQGVRFHCKKWLARIKHNGKSIYLGMYKNKSDAINAYQQAVKRLRNTFLNKE